MREQCPTCKRDRYREPEHRCEGEPQYVIVEWQGYGCETGCGGLQAFVVYPSGDQYQANDRFEFGGDDDEEARYMGREAANKWGVPFREDLSNFSSLW